MLLDSASLYYRAFFGVPDQRTDPSQPPTNALRGFLDMIASLVTTHQPTHLVACWDNDWRPQFRVDAIPTYKTHRLLDGSLEEEQTPTTSRPRCRPSAMRWPHWVSRAWARTAMRRTT